MLNIEQILIRNTKIREMPSHAFRLIVGHRNKLWKILIENGVLETIGTNFFMA